MLLSRLSIPAPVLERLKDATAPERPLERQRRIAELCRKLEPDAVADLLKAGATQAIAGESAGVRLLTGVLAVTRPGAEVLGQLRGLPSLRRVSQQITSGAWREPEDAIDVHPAQPIVAVLEEGARLGPLDLELDEIPRDRIALGAVNQYLSAWFDRIVIGFQSGQPVPEELFFITQLAMLEVALLEKRVALLASRIDPDDQKRVAKLLPFLSQVDQDIAHMKDVVSRISTYQPFFDRTLTVEQAMTSRQLDQLVQQLAGDAAGTAVAQIVQAMRQRPILSRELAVLVSQLHQLAHLRAARVAGARPPDLLSILWQVIEGREDDGSLAVDLEPEVASAIWDEVASWGAGRPAPGTIRLRYRGGLNQGFIAADGTPELPAGDGKERELSLTELIRKQIDNDPFILGLLDNPKALAMPGLIPMLARDSRSLRVLDRIIRVRRLHTGAANRDVPRRLLANPAHIPVSSLRPFIHVRFVGKTDLRHMARRGSEVRQEVAREIANYLAKLG